jgi:hypothetical protein
MQQCYAVEERCFLRGPCQDVGSCREVRRVGGWCEIGVESVVELVRRLLELRFVVSCCCEKLVAEVRDSSGTERIGNERRCKPLPSNAIEDVTVDISVYNSDM